ncbi:MAG: hypothetical protein WCX46_04605 [Candidatus Paceibacterota bacterium]
MKMNGKKLFKEIYGGIEVRKKVRIAGIQLDIGVKIGRWLGIPGILKDNTKKQIEICDYIKHNFEVEKNGNVYIIIGIY